MTHPLYLKQNNNFKFPQTNNKSYTIEKATRQYFAHFIRPGSSRSLHCDKLNLAACDWNENREAVKLGSTTNKQLSSFQKHNYILLECRYLVARL